MVDVTYPPVDTVIAAPYQACPSPLQPGERFVHGINVRLRDSGVHELYAVNHVGRESVEVYDLDSNQPVPILRWKGCIPLPESLFGNAVSPLPNGGLVISISYDSTDPKLMEKMMAGEKTGHALEWFPAQGLSKVPGSELSVNNGIETSADGEWLYINSSGRGELTRMPRSGVETFAVCELDSAIVEIDPLSMEIINVVSRSRTPVFGAVTSAIRIDDTLWLGTLRGNRVGYMTMADD